MSYIEINIVEYNKNKDIDFESNEIDKLSKYYPNLQLYKSHNRDVIIIDFKYLKINIKKSEDDFYVVNFFKTPFVLKIISKEQLDFENSKKIDHFYKCDQLSGLLKCLKEITK